MADQPLMTGEVPVVSTAPAAPAAPAAPDSFKINHAIGAFTVLSLIAGAITASAKYLGQSEEAVMAYQATAGTIAVLATLAATAFALMKLYEKIDDKKSDADADTKSYQKFMYTGAILFALQAAALTVPLLSSDDFKNANGYTNLITHDYLAMLLGFTMIVTLSAMAYRQMFRSIDNPYIENKIEDKRENLEVKVGGSILFVMASMGLMSGAGLLYLYVINPAYGSNNAPDQVNESSFSAFSSDSSSSLSGNNGGLSDFLSSDNPVILTCFAIMALAAMVGVKAYQSAPSFSSFWSKQDNGSNKPRSRTLEMQGM